MVLQTKNIVGYDLLNHHLQILRALDTTHQWTWRSSLINVGSSCLLITRTWKDPFPVTQNYTREAIRIPIAFFAIGMSDRRLYVILTHWLWTHCITLNILISDSCLTEVIEESNISTSANRSYILFRIIQVKHSELVVTYKLGSNVFRQMFLLNSFQKEPEYEYFPGNLSILEPFAVKLRNSKST